MFLMNIYYVRQFLCILQKKELFKVFRKRKQNITNSFIKTLSRDYEVLKHLQTLLQTALGTHDLGQFYYKPLREASGSTILVTVNNISDPKIVTFGSGKWIPITKLQRRQSASLVEISEAQDCLVTSFNVS